MASTVTSIHRILIADDPPDVLESVTIQYAASSLVNMMSSGDRRRSLLAGDPYLEIACKQAPTICIDTAEGFRALRCIMSGSRYVAGSASQFVEKGASS
jgi:hypothetical protein